MGPVSPHERTAVILLFLLPFPSHTYQQHIKCITAMRIKILFCLSSLSNGFEYPGFLIAAYFHISACRYSCTVVSQICFYLHKPHNSVCKNYMLRWTTQRGKRIVNNFCDVDGGRGFLSTICHFKTYNTSRK